MAQQNITLGKKDILRIITDNCGGPFKILLQGTLNSVLRAEASAQLQMQRFERSEKRTDVRNGFRSRYLKTSGGRISLNVPRYRNGTFRSKTLENYQDNESAVLKLIAEMTISGVTIKKASQILKLLCGTTYSKACEDDLCRSLEIELKHFRNLQIGGRYSVLMLDGFNCLKRVNGKMNRSVFMVAYVIAEHGDKEIVAFDIFENESQATWTEFLKGLKKRGFEGIILIPSEPHEGMDDALKEIYPYSTYTY